MKTVMMNVSKLTSEVQQKLEAQGYEIIWSRLTNAGATLKVRKVW